MTSSSLRFDHLQHQFEENPRRHFVPLANAFLRAGNARRAVELCRTFLPQLPGHVSGHVVLAEALQALGRPLLVGPSRKRFLGAVTGLPVEERDRATAAACALAARTAAARARIRAECGRYRGRGCAKTTPSAPTARPSVSWARGWRRTVARRGRTGRRSAP